MTSVQMSRHEPSIASCPRSQIYHCSDMQWELESGAIPVLRGRRVQHLESSRNGTSGVCSNFVRYLGVQKSESFRCTAAFHIRRNLSRFWSLSCCTTYHGFIYPLISIAVLRSTTHRSALRTLHLLFIVSHNRTSDQSFNSSYICAVSTPQQNSTRRKNDEPTSQSARYLGTVGSAL
jgi:hypothetical protein